MVSNFNSGTTVTFPLYIFGASQRGIPVEVNVLSTMLFALAAAALCLVALAAAPGRAPQPAAARQLLRRLAGRLTAGESRAEVRRRGDDAVGEQRARARRASRPRHSFEDRGGVLAEVLGRRQRRPG